MHGRCLSTHSVNVSFLPDSRELGACLQLACSGWAPMLCGIWAMWWTQSLSSWSRVYGEDKVTDYTTGTWIISMKGRYIKHLEAFNRGTWLQLGAGKGLLRQWCFSWDLQRHHILFLVPFLHWKDWCWSSNTLATWFEKPTHWIRPWCLERLRAGGEGGNRGWDG